MLLSTRKSEINENVVVDLEGGHLGVVANRDSADTMYDTEYEFYISGYSHKIRKDGTFVVYLRRVRRELGQFLIRTKTFRTTENGTSTSAIIGDRVKRIYPTGWWPGSIMTSDVFDKQLPFPEIETSMWISPNTETGKLYGVGVDSVEDIFYAVEKRPDFQRALMFRNQMLSVPEASMMTDITAPELFQAIREQYNIV